LYLVFKYHIQSIFVKKQNNVPNIFFAAYDVPK